MIELKFQKPRLSDQELISRYFNHHTSRSCERTFANIYLWSRKSPVTFCIVEQTLVFKRETKSDCAFTYPAGEPHEVRAALAVLEAYSRERGFPFKLYFVTRDQFAKLEAEYPDRFEINYIRDAADYVYEQEKLATLAGKKLHGKRNHVNKFMNTYEGRWSYEALTPDNVEDCFQMAIKWSEQNGGYEDPEKNAEITVTLNSLRLLEELGYVGGVLRIDGTVVAFTIGERVCSDTFVVHIEKAYADVPGAYTVINQQFVLHECADYKYINREDDAGAPGLRKAKLSYRPAFLVEKGEVTIKGENRNDSRQND